MLQFSTRIVSVGPIVSEIKSFKVDKSALPVSIYSPRHHMAKIGNFDRSLLFPHIS